MALFPARIMSMGHAPIGGCIRVSRGVESTTEEGALFSHPRTAPLRTCRGLWIGDQS
jgi:hypothetical protein